MTFQGTHAWTLRESIFRSSNSMYFAPKTGLAETKINFFKISLLPLQKKRHLFHSSQILPPGIAPRFKKPLKRPEEQFKIYERDEGSFNPRTINPVHQPN